MTKQAFDKIATGLHAAAGIQRGEAEPSTCRVHDPAHFEVKGTQGNASPTTDQISAFYDFSDGAVCDWE